MSTDLKNILKYHKDIYYSLKNYINISWRIVFWSNTTHCISKLDHINSKSTLIHELLYLIEYDTELLKRREVF